ncbi:uncharacterized protein F5147DRAFT_648318 [Suillus discolor]|uniref:Uncharacterized protein n=1 Tax=Suillus discolor TaxID=1912936 RepID=A0A9P7FIH7_9AGAM|nr:uncharacterized protein F5147DRAFT_648318 [Suillus discolor]KAG2117878.1 hypothetical protein F5147DRAFT_648318 [Suillus discolor]
MPSLTTPPPMTLIAAPTPVPVPAPAPAPIKKLPCITQQLDPLWISDLNARVQHEVKQQRITEHRKEMEKAVKQQFILHWYDADNAPVIEEWVTNCPFFPQFQLADDSVLVDLLGEEINKIEVFDEHIQRWIPAGLTHTFSLQSGCHIFIRRQGVTICEGFNDLYKASRCSVCPPHLCYNMKGEREGVHMKIKHKLDVPVPSDSGSDVEIVEMPVTPIAVGKGKRRCEGSPRDIDTNPPILIHCRLDLNDFNTCRASSLSPTPLSAPQTMLSSSDHRRFDLDDFDVCRPSSMSPTPPLSTLQSRSALTKVSDTTEPLITEVFVPAYNSTKQVWPQGMYTTDMVMGFEQMDDKNLRMRFQQDDLFHRIFGVPFVKATYHENHCAWQKMDPSILAIYEAAGQTVNGLWLHYLATCRAALGEKTKKPGRQAK